MKEEWLWINTYTYHFEGDEHPFTSHFDVHQGDRVLTPKWRSQCFYRTHFAIPKSARFFCLDRSVDMVQWWQRGSAAAELPKLNCRP
jgi:hypothetical protein